MGIKRFGTRMRDYAIRSTLGSTDSPAKDSIAIIDGPGLAHHVFYQLCDKVNSTSSDFSYNAYVDAAMAWLKDLRSIGLKIEAIFFDGALPASKKNVRIGRLQGYVDRLHAYKEALGSAPPTFSGQARKTSPPPPFLVFAIIEDLLLSTEFSNVTFMVPGEADPYCVAAAQAAADEPTCTIFSDDADLLVYRLGQRACVVPFRDLSVSNTASGITWIGEQYWPAEIVKRSPTAIDDLIKPAYLMAEDPYCSYEQACRELKLNDPCKRPDFESFSQTFQTTEEVVQWAEIQSRSKTQSSHPGRDSRISELVHQLEQLSNGVDQGCLRMYLPFICDDPSKKTAWTVGMELRTLAYLVLLQNKAVNASVQEYRRSGSRIVSLIVESQDDGQASDQASQLADHISQVLTWATEDHDLPEVDAWRCLILQHTLTSLHADGYSLASVEDSVRVVKQDERSTWPSIHLSGQYQAAFYSLRMIKQVVGHVAAQEGRQDSSWQHAIEKLGQQLESLPRISTFFAKGKTEDSRLRAVVREFLATFDGSNDEEQERPRKKAKKSKKSGKAQPAILEKNPFALLGDD